MPRSFETACNHHFRATPSAAWTRWLRGIRQELPRACSRCVQRRLADRSPGAPANPAAIRPSRSSVRIAPLARLGHGVPCHQGELAKGEGKVRLRMPHQGRGDALPNLHLRPGRMRGLACGASRREGRRQIAAMKAASAPRFARRTLLQGRSRSGTARSRRNAPDSIGRS